MPEDNKTANGGQEPKKNGQPKAETAQQTPSKPQDSQEYKDLKESMLRLAAEFDNYKKRTKADSENSRNFGKAELMRSLLPIIDEFELALIAVNKTEDKNIAKGVEMLYSNFIDTLKKDGLTEIQCKGVFDPYIHEIVMTKESKEKGGTILEVIKKGYSFDKTLLRPASVIVAKDGANSAETDKK
jgi:molecular chaperone GrpE